MLPTREFFKKIECPYYNFTIKGSCNRPHCHFKHSRRDADYDFSEPVVEQIADKNKLNAEFDEDVSPEESDEETEPHQNTKSSNNQNLSEEPGVKSVEDEEGREEPHEEEEPEKESEPKEIELDEEENLLRFKKALMNSIKDVIDAYPKLFYKNINTKDFNHLIDEFIKNLINYEEIESVEIKKLTYNPTPIIELRKQERRIKTQLPYIPECVKVNQPVLTDTLDIDSDLKYLEDLIQNDSLFATSNELVNDTYENLEGALEQDKKEEDEIRSTDKEDKCKDKTSREKSKSYHSRTDDLNTSSKDKSSSSKGDKVINSKEDKSGSSKEEKYSSSKDEKSSSSKNEKSSSFKEKHKSSRKRSSSSCKDSRSHGSSSSRSKHSHKRARSKSRSSSRSKSSDPKKSKHSSSRSHRKSETASTIVISSESSDDDGFDAYGNMDVYDERDNGENLVVNDNTSPRPEKEDSYDEPDYIRKKKKQRIAHVDIFGMPSNPAPVSNRAKVMNPNDRFKEIQEKYKGLNRNAQTKASDPSNSVKISHVPNVNLMLTAKKTLTPPSPASLSINKNSLLMSDILKRTELKKTIAQTSKKSNRVAHVPPTGAGATASKPMIQVDSKGTTRIPLVIRQTCLDRIFALYSKYVPPDLASDRAVQVEMETYEKCHAAKSYQNSIANSILRIRKEQSGFFMGSKPQLR